MTPQVQSGPVKQQQIPANSQAEASVTHVTGTVQLSHAQPYGTRVPTGLAASAAAPDVYQPSNSTASVELNNL